jgi:hypothetical protein
LQSATSGSSSAVQLSTQAKSITDGLTNTAEIIAAYPTYYPAAKYCNDLVYAGYSDWYLPSLMEMELMYRVLKPGSGVNNVIPSPVSDLNIYVGSGNPKQVLGDLANENTTLLPSFTTTPARPSNYTNAGGIASIPRETLSSIFKTGGPEAFGSNPYYTSSGPSGNTAFRNQMSGFTFSNGGWQGEVSSQGSFPENNYAGPSSTWTTTVRPVRPVRRVFLRNVS